MTPEEAQGATERKWAEWDIGQSPYDRCGWCQWVRDKVEEVGWRGSWFILPCETFCPCEWVFQDKDGMCGSRVLDDFLCLYDRIQKQENIGKRDEKALRKAARAVYRQLAENREALIAAAREIDGQ